MVVVVAQKGYTPASATDGFTFGRDYESEKRITGTVTRLFHESETFSAGVLAVINGDPIHKDCRFAVRDHVAVGEKIALRGSWDNTKYGWQFVADVVEYPSPDLSPEGLAHYLATEKEFAGLGPVKARLIAEAFGAEFDQVIRHEPERIADVGKLTPEQAETLRQTWTERQDVNAISMWLGEYGLTAGQVRSIAKAFGNRARQVLTNNPYVLHEKIAGIGFQRNDEIALKMGVEPMDPHRIKSAINYLINQAHEESGHTYMPKAELQSLVIKSLYLDDLGAPDLIAAQIEEMSTDAGGCKLALVEIDGAEHVGSAALYYQEGQILSWLRDRASALPVDYSDVDPTSTGLNRLTEEQQLAVRTALTSPVSIITGGAGTGKSHTIRAIMNVLQTLDQTVEIAAPTGKAARRLQQDGVPAKTIHRLLEYSKMAGGFTRDEQNPLDCSAVIIDESSMCAIPLLHSLCRAINFKHARLILVGDYNQLPPIGAGNTLRDFVDNDLVPVSKLTKCHRNAGQLKENCVAVLSGNVRTEPAAINKENNPDDNSLQSLTDTTPAWSIISDCLDTQRVVDLCCLLQSSQFAAWGFDPLLDCQIITPQRPGPLGMNRLNLELQRVEQQKRGVSLPEITDPNRRPDLLVGDKVMQTINNYEMTLMNGTQGVVLAITHEPDPDESGANKDKPYPWLSIQFDDRPEGELLRIRQDKNNLVLSYAVTVHKVQGSQYPCVVSIVHRTHTYMLSRNLLYTAVSRARYSSIILGELIGIRRAARTINNMERRTWTGLYQRASRENKESGLTHSR